MRPKRWLRCSTMLSQYVIVRAVQCARDASAFLSNRASWLASCKTLARPRPCGFRTNVLPHLPVDASWEGWNNQRTDPEGDKTRGVRGIHDAQSSVADGAAAKEVLFSKASIAVCILQQELLLKRIPGA